jgi:long-chain acyl-CoA synthetase
MSPREIEVIRAHCCPRVSIFTSHSSRDAAQHAERARAHYLTSGRFAGLAIGPTDASAVAESEELARQVATVIYTSGTTGSPKGVMVTHRGLLHFCGVSSSSRGLAPSDRVYAALPLSHIFGIATVVLATLYAGASIYLERAFSPERALDALSKSEISILQGVPIMFRRLLTQLQQRSQSPNFAKLRYLYTGGGPLDASLKRQVEAMFGLPLHHGYGMTEYAGSMFITRVELPRKDCSSGLLNPGCSVRIVDAHGQDVPSGSAGDILVRGPGTMLGYYRAPEATCEALSEDGWLKTGDTGRIEPDGALFVVGRSKDLIKRSGFNVYPIEVEALLNACAGIKLSAVVGRPLPDGDEEVVAFVELETGARFDAADIAASLVNQLAPYKRPARILPIAVMPVNANGKVLKHELKARLNES